MSITKGLEKLWKGVGGKGTTVISDENGGGDPPSNYNSKVGRNHEKASETIQGKEISGGEPRL